MLAGWIGCHLKNTMVWRGGWNSKAPSTLPRCVTAKLRAGCHPSTIQKRTEKMIKEQKGEINWILSYQLKQLMIQTLPHHPTNVSRSDPTDPIGLGSETFTLLKCSLGFILPHSWAKFSGTCTEGLLGANLIVHSTGSLPVSAALERFQGIR